MVSLFALPAAVVSKSCSRNFVPSPFSSLRFVTLQTLWSTTLDPTTAWRVSCCGSAAVRRVVLPFAHYLPDVCHTYRPSEPVYTL